MGKRTRATNFTCDEKDTLMDIINESKSIVDNKRTDAKVWREKNEEWESITKKYNSQTLVIRTPKGLRAKYDALKKLSRQRKTAESQLVQTANGDPHEPINQDRKSYTLNRVLDIIDWSAEDEQARLPQEQSEAQTTNKKNRNGNPERDHLDTVSAFEKLADAKIRLVNRQIAALKAKCRRGEELHQLNSSILRKELEHRNTVLEREMLKLQRLTERIE